MENDEIELGEIVEEKQILLDDGPQEMDGEVTISSKRCGLSWKFGLVLLILLIGVFLAIGVLVLAYLIWPAPAIVILEMKGYRVVFDRDLCVPISSTMVEWISKPPTQRPPWSNHTESRIKVYDFWTQVPFPGTKDFYDRGHLSPYADLGAPSMSVINVVPQIKCHNSGVWNYFETFVRKEYFGRAIVTYPKYNYTSWFETANGRLYIPMQICKSIPGVGNFCMDHHSGVCGKKWCTLLQPSLNATC